MLQLFIKAARKPFWLSLKNSMVTNGYLAKIADHGEGVFHVHLQIDHGKDP